jgi:hypothetical protein
LGEYLCSVSDKHHNGCELGRLPVELTEKYGLHSWRKNSTSIFFDKYRLVAAEGFGWKIRCLEDEALSNELAAAFYYERGLLTSVQAYIENARAPAIATGGHLASSDNSNSITRAQSDGRDCLCPY